MNQQLVFLQYTLSFVLHLLVQILFVHNLELFGVAFCFLYLNFMITLPLYSNRSLLLVVAFVLGVLMDSFYDTLGVHAFACVLIAYLRPFVIGSISSKTEITELRIQSTGFSWFAIYSMVLIFIHHLFIFFFQQFNFKMFIDTSLRVMASSLFTWLVVILIQYFFYSNSKNAR